MATHLISWTCDRNIATNQRRASAPVATANHQHNKPTHHTCCSDDRVHGCGCGCRSCCCRYKPIKDESNRNAWGGEGGRGFPKPVMAVSGSETRSGSFASRYSGHTGTESINNSYEVQDPLNDRLFADDIYQHNHTRLATAVIRHATTAFAQDEVDDNPWPNFVSPGHSDDSDDSTGMLFENMDGSSMMMEVDGPTSGDTSMLSNYESSFRRQSVTTSQVLTGAGTSFPGNTFLPLTPESQHERHGQLCEHCAH